MPSSGLMPSLIIENTVSQKDYSKGYVFVVFSSLSHKMTFILLREIIVFNIQVTIIEI